MGCHYAGCNHNYTERCNSCKELFCNEHINNHNFCKRAKKYQESIKDETKMNFNLKTKVGEFEVKLTEIVCLNCKRVFGYSNSQKLVEICLDCFGQLKYQLKE